MINDECSNNNWIVGKRSMRNLRLWNSFYNPCSFWPSILFKVPYWFSDKYKIQRLTLVKEVHSRHSRQTSHSLFSLRRKSLRGRKKVNIHLKNKYNLASLFIFCQFCNCFSCKWNCDDNFTSAIYSLICFTDSIYNSIQNSSVLLTFGSSGAKLWARI